MVIRWFPKYIFFGKDNDVWVLRKLYNDKCAYYWCISWEYGRTIHYDGLHYRISQPIGNYDIIKDILIEATLNEFLENNPMCITEWSMKKCMEILEKIKKN